ncbi:hypothetical protein ACFYUL_33400 [Streptomyces sp. NPDC004311]|uniref:hypothetical protein n=1 Tax=Streptomyces sp. NPDC004311 TaxID=3364698 RepID=UPI0036A079E3
MRRAFRSLLVFGTVAASVLATAGTGQAAPSPGRSDFSDTAPTDLPSTSGMQASIALGACVRAHVAGYGWQKEWACNNLHYTGTVGQNRAIEALQIWISGAGRFCAKAHTRNHGWDKNETCANGEQIATVGTTGMARPMEAVRVTIQSNTGSERLDGWSHIQETGWLYHPTVGQEAILGTIGRARNLEAVSIGIS